MERVGRKENENEEVKRGEEGGVKGKKGVKFTWRECVERKKGWGDNRGGKEGRKEGCTKRQKKKKLKRAKEECEIWKGMENEKWE